MQAAIRAGYSKTSARANAFRYLRRPGVIEAVQAAMEERAQRTTVSQDRVVEELAAIAFFDPAEIAVLPLNGPTDIEHLPKRVRAAVAAWGWDAQGNFMVKLHKKLPALEMLAKHLGMFIERKHVDINGQRPLAAEPISATQQWLEEMIEDETADVKGYNRNQSKIGRG